MVKIRLVRGGTSSDGTFGVLYNGQIPLCVTCEDPWNENKTGISCIPDGTYRCVKHSGTKYKNVWILENVPNRSAILIHSGNSINDTQGCILVGQAFSGPRITQSQLTLQYLREHLPDTFDLEIKWCAK